MTARDTSGTAKERTFDWPAAYERLNRAVAKLEAAENPSLEQVQRVLRERAERQAERAELDKVQAVDVIAFDLEEYRLAITLDEGTAAISLSGLIPLPGVPAFYLGLLSHRGQVYPIIDVRPLLGAQLGDASRLGYAVLCHSGHGAIGFAATSVLGITKLPVNRIAVGAADALRSKAISGLGADSRIVIDVVQFLENARLLVDDQPALAAREEGKVR